MVVVVVCIFMMISLVVAVIRFHIIWVFGGDITPPGVVCPELAVSVSEELLLVRHRLPCAKALETIAFCPSAASGSPMQVILTNCSCYLPIQIDSTQQRRKL